jgi:hypothetical protein
MVYSRSFQVPDLLEQDELASTLDPNLPPPSFYLVSSQIGNSSPGAVDSTDHDTGPSSTTSTYSAPALLYMALLSLLLRLGGHRVR